MALHAFRPRLGTARDCGMDDLPAPLLADPVAAELRSFERRWRVPSFVIAERGERPDGIADADLARWLDLWAQHQQRGWASVGAMPTSQPPAPYTPRAARARDPNAKPPAPLWRRGSGAST